MKLSKKAKIAILRGKVAKLKFQLKQARDELALQDDQLDRFKTLNESLPTTVRKEKTKGIICYSNDFFGKCYYKSTEGNVKYFSDDKKDAIALESLEEFFSKNPDTINKGLYSFEPIEDVKEKKLGVVTHTNGDEVLYVCQDKGKLDFTIYRSMAERFESLQDFFSKYPVTKGVRKYKFEPIESKGGENVNVQINEQTR